MAIEKQIKTKISLRYLEYKTWSAEIFKTEKPLKGEVWFCEIPTGNANATTAPTMLFKVGDGVNTFGNLQWASALAADVYAWAKKDHLDVNDLPTLPLSIRDAESGKFITNIEYAVDVITIHRGDVEWNDITNKPNLVNSVKATDDDVVILTPETAASGDVTITGAHAKKGPSAGYTGSTNIKGGTAVVGTELDIKVPVLTVDAYGHTNAVNEASYKITIPKATAPNDGELTLKASNGLTATEKVFTANDPNNVTFEVSHANTSDAADLVADGRKYVTGLTFDDFGHVTGYTTGEEVDQDLSHNHDDTYKKIQAVVNDPTASGESLTFIDSISQNAQGVITPTKKTVKLGDYLKTADETAITITDKANTDTDDLVYAVSNLEEGGTKGHAITATYKAVATKAYVDKMAAGAVDYLGTVEKLADLDTEAGYGDFHRVATEIKSGDTVLAHAGDLLVAEKANPAQQIDGANWSVIHGDEGRITNVVAEGALEGGGSVGEIYIDVKSEGITEDKIADGAVTEEKLDSGLKTLIRNSIKTVEACESDGGNDNNSARINIVDNNDNDDYVSFYGDDLIKLSSTVRGPIKIEGNTALTTAVSNANTAHSWGNHANAGYLKSGDITGKADKKVPAAVGNLASLDANGNLADSGKKVSDFEASGAVAGIFGYTTSDKNYALQKDANGKAFVNVPWVWDALSASQDGYVSKDWYAPLSDFTSRWVTSDMGPYGYFMKDSFSVRGTYSDEKPWAIYEYATLVPGALHLSISDDSTYRSTTYAHRAIRQDINGTECSIELPDHGGLMAVIDEYGQLGGAYEHELKSLVFGYDNYWAEIGGVDGSGYLTVSNADSSNVATIYTTYGNEFIHYHNVTGDEVTVKLPNTNYVTGEAEMAVIQNGTIANGLNYIQFGLGANGESSGSTYTYINDLGIHLWGGAAQDHLEISANGFITHTADVYGEGGEHTCNVTLPHVSGELVVSGSTEIVYVLDCN